MADDELSLQKQFELCECVVEDLMKDRFGDSKSPKRIEILKDIVERLQSLSRMIDQLSLFSANDSVEELPTLSIRCLLVPAYFAFVLQESHVESKKRHIYLNSAKASYREFLQKLLTFGLINFKLPWVENEQNDAECSSTKTRVNTNFEDLLAKRRQKITRLQRLQQLEDTLEKLRIEERRNDDEATKRELYFVLLRFWALKALNELDIIDEELKVLEQLDSMHNSQPRSSNETAQIGAIKPFIIARNEHQKKVFGLGYPSIPTVTVDEWFEGMQKSGGFGKIFSSSSASSSNKRKLDTFKIDRNCSDSGGEEQHSFDEEEEEKKRQAKIRMDEWKDINPRGWGNTYNKG